MSAALEDAHATPWGSVNALAVDTTTDWLSVAVVRGGALQGVLHERIGRRITQEILPGVDGLLRAAGLTVPALDVLVVGCGPGSFTGTRIGMAVAMTFANMAGKPLLGVDALTLLAAGAHPELGPRTAPQGFRVLLNCARAEVYHARFRWADAGPQLLGEIALSNMTVLREAHGPELTAQPTLLRRFAPPDQTSAAASAKHDALFAGLQALPLGPERAEAVRLLEVGLPRYLATPEADFGTPQPLYLKSEALRRWQPPATGQPQATAQRSATAPSAASATVLPEPGP